MAGYRKLGRTSSQRKAMLRSLTTALIVNGKIKTTDTRAKEVRKEVEHLIALAVKEKDNFEEVTVKAKVPRKDKDGKEPLTLHINLIPHPPKSNIYTLIYYTKEVNLRNVF